MIAELLGTLFRLNLAGGAAILSVLAVRVPARRWFGAEVASAAWLLVPVASAAGLLPGPASAPTVSLISTGTTWLSGGARPAVLSVLWLCGVFICAAATLIGHFRFVVAARAGRAGPAVAGIVVPRLVIPADYADRFTAEERRLIRAHEQAHIARKDLRNNALAVVATWLCWFNPLAHLALGLLRIDQDHACDAAVLRREPSARRRYAETLLRAQWGGGGPLACGWRAAWHPLETRIQAAMRSQPSQRARDCGAAGLAGLVMTTFAATWLAQPAHAPPPALPQPIVIFFDLQPPTPALTAWAYPASEQPR
jgi:beta-lactamase regulating signal transducer with metallopeptidase domain